MLANYARKLRRTICLAMGKARGQHARACGWTDSTIFSFPVRLTLQTQAATKVHVNRGQNAQERRTEFNQWLQRLLRGSHCTQSEKAANETAHVARRGGERNAMRFAGQMLRKHHTAHIRNVTHEPRGM